MLLFNLLSTSGLALPVRRTLRELVEEVVECRVVADRKEIDRVREELLVNEEASTSLALRLVRAEKEWDSARRVADSRWE